MVSRLSRCELVSESGVLGVVSSHALQSTLFGGKMKLGMQMNE
jgi:hypothetical protein